MNTELAAIIAGFDNRTEPFEELDISAAIPNGLVPREALTPEDKAELMAFDFTPDQEDFEWGTYYGPQVSFGPSQCSPSLSLVNSEVIGVWERRANEAKHPLLRARYADLVWDLSRKTTGKVPSHTYAQLVIDCNLQLVAQGKCDEHDSIKKLERAAKLAAKLKDSTRIDACKTTMLDYEHRLSKQTPPGWVGFAFDMLIEEQILKPTEEEEERLVIEAHDRLLSNLGRTLDVSPWDAETDGLRLARYFHKKADSQKVDFYLQKIEEAYDSRMATAEPLQKLAWLGKVHEHYVQFGKHEDASRIHRRIETIGPEVVDSMKTIKISQSIPVEDFDRAVDEYVEGSLPRALTRITAAFLPRREKLWDSVQQLAKSSPLLFNLRQDLIGTKGFVVGRIRAVDEDKDGHLIQQMVRSIAISDIFLDECFKRLRAEKGLDAGTLYEFFGASPLFVAPDDALLRYGLDLYFRGEYVAAIHVICPQIEALLRRLLNGMGESTTKRGRSGFYQEKLLDELLRLPVLVATFGEDVLFYLRVLLTDQRGLNYRNGLSHGLLPLDAFTQAAANRLIHALLIFGALRTKEN